MCTHTLPAAPGRATVRTMPARFAVPLAVAALAAAALPAGAQAREGDQPKAGPPAVSATVSLGPVTINRSIPASYAFRLDASAEAKPDEDFTERPSVSFGSANGTHCVEFAWPPIHLVLCRGPRSPDKRAGR